jgi:hypothetical protein
MGETCSTNVEVINLYKYLQDLGLDDRIILKLILYKCVGLVQITWS